jgi:hypothetical protein
MIHRIGPLLLILAVISGLWLSQQLWRWAVYGEERALVRGMRPELVEVGADIVRTRMASDSMRKVMGAEDNALEAEQQELRRYNRLARNGTLPLDLYQGYKRDLARYNEHVTHRNARLRDWQEILTRNHAAVDRYNVLADSVRVLTTRMGDPFYPVPSPLDAAVERGLIKPEQ